MPRIKALNKSEASEKAQTLLEGVEKKLGKVPNLMGTMAHSPAVLESYLGFSAAVSKGALPAKLREQIALVVGESNNCEYCVAAHSALGRLAGLSNEEITDSRRGSSPDSKTESALSFARKIVKERGFVSDEDVTALRSAGYDDGAITEIVANVALNIFTNYFNHVAQTDVDFPRQPALKTEHSCACSA